MKKLFLTFVLSVLMAGASHAYVQVGHLAQTKLDDPSKSSSTTDAVQLTVEVEGDDKGDKDAPTAPVPEPGTIALASMGLMALGAAHRRRKQK